MSEVAGISRINFLRSAKCGKCENVMLSFHEGTFCFQPTFGNSFTPQSLDLSRTVFVSDLVFFPSATNKLFPRKQKQRGRSRLGQLNRAFPLLPASSLSSRSYLSLSDAIYLSIAHSRRAALDETWTGLGSRNTLGKEEQR